MARWARGRLPFAPSDRDALEVSDAVLVLFPLRGFVMRHPLWLILHDGGRGVSVAVSAVLTALKANSCEKSPFERQETHLEEPHRLDVIARVQSEAVVDIRRDNEQIPGLYGNADPAGLRRVWVFFEVAKMMA